MLYDGQLDEAVIYKIKIHIIRSKVFQRLFKCWSYVIWIMSCIPEFARDLSSHILFSYLSKRSIPKWFLRIVPSVECQMLWFLDRQQLRSDTQERNRCDDIQFEALLSLYSQLSLDLELELWWRTGLASVN
jgi:hypothetical protein